MTELELSNWEYRYTVRTEGMFSNPKGYDIANWILPKNVALHYLPMAVTDLGPGDDWFPLRNFPRQHYVYHVPELTSTEGRPRVLGAVNIANMGKLYYRTVKNVKRVGKLPMALLDKKFPIVFNYAMLTPKYRYQRNAWSRLWRFNNMWATMLKNVEETCNTSSRQHLIFVDLPEVLPPRAHFHSVEEFEEEVKATGLNAPLSGIKEARLAGEPSLRFSDLFRKASSEMARHLGNDAYDQMDSAMESFDETSLGWGSDDLVIDLEGCDCDISFEAWSRMTLGWFPDDQSLRVADIWRWMSEKREASALNQISPENYGKVWFVFTCGGRYNIISMAKLDMWREATSISGISNKFHKYMIGLMAFRQTDAKDVVLATVPRDETEKPVTLGMIPTSDSDATVVEDEETSAELAVGAVRQQFAGNKQLMINEKVADISELDSADITEVEAEELAELPPERTEQIVSKPVEDTVVHVDTTNPLEAGIALKSAALLSRGIISQAEHQRHLRLGRKYKEIKVGSQTLEEHAKVPEEKIWNFKPAEIPDIPYVTDKGMLQSSLINFDQEYVNGVMEHDTANMILSLQRAGIAITGFEKEEYTDALSRTIDYRIKVTPVYGKESTLSFQLPKVDRNGKYMINGVKYYMRKLRMDKPIRKINTSEVCLTSYYGKLFVERSKKKVSSFDNWLISAITNDILSGQGKISGAVYGNSYGENQPVPRMYSALAQTYLEFQLEGIHFYWDYHAIEKNFPTRIKAPNRIPVGKKGDSIIYMDKVGKLYEGGDKSIGSIPSLLGMDESSSPEEVVVLRCMGQEIPIGIVLAYLVGINKLAEVLYSGKVSLESAYYPEMGGAESILSELAISLEADEVRPQYPRRRIKGAKRDTTRDEFEVVFGDEIWVFPRDNSKASMIFASLNLWKKHIRTIQVAELNDRSYYQPMFMEAGLSARHLNEIGLIDELFLDPIAIENLKHMGEPTAMKPLFIRAVEMLVDDNHKSDLDTSLILVKGYERMNGAVYKAVTDAVRNYRNKPISTKTSIDLNPFEVLTAIQKDPSVSLVEDSNVIHNLKEKENMTYSGTGGRSKRAMTRRTRVFHKSDIGVRSESGVDSGDVGINMFMPPNPNIKSLRGAVETVDVNKAPMSSIVSTSMLTSPFAEYDDPKRVNFIGIQQDHVVSISNPDPMFIRTGYDQVLAHRSDDLFSFTAKQDGEVVDVTDRVITIKYKDGTVETCQIGRRFGVVTGHVVPHEIKTDLKPGDKFKVGRVISYNSGFYRPDPRDPTQVSLLSGTYAYTALLEKNETWEDSSLISKELAHRMRSKTTHIRTLLVKFTDAVHNLVTVGETMDIDSILATIEDKTLAAVGSSNLEALNMLSRPSPRAHYAGLVEEIQVIYFGDKDDMSPSLRKIADKYDRERAKLASQLNDGSAKTGEITTPARVDGSQVDIDMMAIRIFITEERIMSGGDKLVLSNQLKSVTAGEQRGPTFTATELWKGSGTRKIELEFSYRAQEARIVHSSIMAGMSVICQEFISDMMVRAYDS
ncbi:hypothetical protein D0726_004082 [Escherichia coli]|nr:hypothetical protein [Escherichia coli]